MADQPLPRVSGNRSGAPQAELRWARKVPTSNGNYWWRQSSGYTAEICLVEGPAVRFFGDGGFPLAVIGGEWYGPLTPPEGECEG